MVRSGLAAAFAAALAFVPLGARAAPLEAYGQLPDMSDVTISPDGAKVAYVVPVDGKQAVVVVSIDPAKILTSFNGSEQKVRDLVWADPDHLLVLKSQAGFAQQVESSRQEWLLAYNFDIALNKVTPLLDDGVQVRGRPITMNVVIGEPEARRVDGHSTVFAKGISFVDSAGVPTLFSIDLATGHQTIIDRASTAREDRDWVIGSDGKALAQSSYNIELQDWKLRLRRGGAWQNAYQTKAALDPPEVEALSDDGQSIIVRTSDNGAGALQPISLADGTLGPEAERYKGLSSVLVDPATHRIIGGRRTDMEAGLAFFDPKDQAVWDSILKVFPGEEVELSSWSDDRSRIVVKVTGDVHGVAYILVDLKTHKTTLVGEAYAGIKPADVAALVTIEYKAADGRKIPAYLTLPNGRDAKNLPLIVLPHGGPATRDMGGFDWWAQALASRGYAVLQPQFRGSYGLSGDLWTAGFGQWGRKMQSDLSDGVRKLAAAGMIDPKRVCIVGGSYGGYAALAGVTIESGVYRCAVSVAGISDVHKMLGLLPDAKTSYTVRSMNRMVGATGPSDPVYDQISPIEFADRLSVPLLLIHGKDDTVVPTKQSRTMADKLKSLGKPVEFVVMSGEDHWLSRSESRLQMLQTMVKFLEANNPPN